MTRSAAIVVCAFVLSTVCPRGLNASADDRSNWPSFRGPGAGGVARADLPEKWDLTNSSNVRWRCPIEGLGHGGPAVWGNQVFVLTADNGAAQPVKTGVFGDIAPVEGEKPFAWKLLCVDLTSGRLLWNRTAVRGEAKIKRHPKSSHANCTPVIDGGRVIVECDVEENSFLADFSLEDGRELWRTPRDEVPTWSTPTIIHPEGRPAQVVCNGHKHAAGYDPGTGKEIWSLAMPGDMPIPTPIFAHDLIFFTSAHGGPSGIFAVRPSAVGDISLPAGQSASQSVAWSTNRGGSYIPTPIVIGDLLYCCNWNGVLTCFDAGSGREVYHTRLPGSEAGFTASPVGTANKLYLVSEEGLVHVVKPGPEFSLLATNSLGAKCLATPAIAHDTLLFRTESGLLAIGKSSR